MNPYLQAMSDIEGATDTLNTEIEIRNGMWLAEDYASERLRLVDVYGIPMDPYLQMWTVAEKFPEKYDRIIDLARLSCISRFEMTARMKRLVNEYEMLQHLEDIERILTA